LANEQFLSILSKINRNDNGRRYHHDHDPLSILSKINRVLLKGINSRSKLSILSKINSRL